MASDGIIYHVALAADWERWAGEDDYVPATFASEGFVHCCRPHQLAGVLRRFFAGRGDALLLRLDSGRLAAPLRYEPADDGEPFPHVYGAINKDAVLDVRPLGPLPGAEA